MPIRIIQAGEFERIGSSSGMVWMKSSTSRRIAARYRFTVAADGQS